MDTLERNYNCAINYNGKEDTYLRKGPWTVEEDALLADYVTIHGEGRWNSAARFSGLKRTGKSCRLRWLNYLRPNIRRGNITLQEQLLILQLQSRWGNRWSKIAQHLPGRTDNEIKNYWRTKVQKLAKQFKCDVNSKQFRESMRLVWMPRLIELIWAADSGSSLGQSSGPDCCKNGNFNYQGDDLDHILGNQGNHRFNESGSEGVDPNFVPDLSGCSSTSLDVQVVSDRRHDSQNPAFINPSGIQTGSGLGQEDDGAWCGWHWHSASYKQQLGQDMEAVELEPQSNGLMVGGDWTSESLWNDDNFWFLRQQLMRT